MGGEDRMEDRKEDRKEAGPARLRLSMFPNVPPYHVFIPYWQSYSDPPGSALQEEEWQFPAQVMPVVRDVVAHAGFKVKKVNAMRGNIFNISIVTLMCAGDFKM